MLILKTQKTENETKRELLKPYTLGGVLAERDADATLDIELLQRTVVVGVLRQLQRPQNGAVLDRTSRRRR